MMIRYHSPNLPMMNLTMLRQRQRPWSRTGLGDLIYPFCPSVSIALNKYRNTQVKQDTYRSGSDGSGGGSGTACNIGCIVDRFLRCVCLLRCGILFAVHLQPAGEVRTRAVQWKRLQTSLSSSDMVAQRLEIIWSSSLFGSSGNLAFSSARTSFWNSRYDDGGRLGALGSLGFRGALFFLPSSSSSRTCALRFALCSPELPSLNRFTPGVRVWPDMVRANSSATFAQRRMLSATWPSFSSS